MALLSVAAVVVVLGGTVAGVKMMSSGGGAADCPGGTCAAVQSSNQPAPKVSDPPADEPVEEEEPVDEPVEEESEPAKSPTPTATYSAREPRRTTSPTPKPKPTKTKQTQEPVDEPIDEATAEEATPEETPTEEVTLDPDRATRPDNGGIPLPTATATETFQGVSSGGSVNVDFNVTSQRLTSYTATMAVTNSSEQALNTFTLSLPVRGKILSVEGATWTQDGNLLIVDLSTPIGAGDSTEITLAATGRAGQPTNCGLVGGDCAVS
jgi:cellulase/cellobiase CelA1